MGVGGQRHASAAFTPGKGPVPIVQEAGWAPGPVWIGAENLAPTGILSPDLPACSKSLYQLRYPSPQRKCKKSTKLIFCHPRHLMHPGRIFSTKILSCQGVFPLAKKGSVIFVIH